MVGNKNGRLMASELASCNQCIGVHGWDCHGDGSAALVSCATRTEHEIILCQISNFIMTTPPPPTLRHDCACWFTE
jgi:hypothetical protein